MTKIEIQLNARVYHNINTIMKSHANNIDFYGVCVCVFV